jgi:cytochrome c556
MMGTAGWVALAAFATCLVFPQGARAQEKPPLLEYRQDLMQALASHSGALRAIREGGVTYASHLLPHAMAIQGIADMLLDVFPPASDGAASRALPAIWERPSEFGAIVEEMRGAATRLAEGARAGDGPAVDEARAVVSGTCQDCHRDFRARPSG